MERHESILGAIASFPNGICICCLVERTGLKHEYLKRLCQELRADEKLRQLDFGRLERHILDRRRPEPKDTCSVCRKTWTYGDVFWPLNGKNALLSETDEPSFSWQELGLAERICELLPASTKFECVDATWLNAQRTIIIKVLNRVARQKTGGEPSLAKRVAEARDAGSLPTKITNYMQTLLALRNSATYEDRRLDLSESLIARVAADQLSMWINENK
jgi:hypothetical protein